MKTQQQKLQYYFNQDIEELKTAEESSLKHERQNHFGDMLIESSNFDGEKYELWRNLDENVAQGEPLIQVYYCGKNNKYTNEEIFNY